MEAIIYRSRTASQPCSLVEFLIGDGVNPGWLDQRVFAGSGDALSSASGSSGGRLRSERQTRAWNREVASVGGGWPDLMELSAVAARCSRMPGAGARGHGVVIRSPWPFDRNRGAAVGGCYMPRVWQR